MWLKTISGAALAAAITAVLAAILTAGLTPRARAETDWSAAMEEAPWDWQPGDLIFHDGQGEFDTLLQEATGDAFASVGILRASSGGPRVIHVEDNDGVTEEALFPFLESLPGRRFAVYRLAEPSALPRQGGQGPLARYALLSAYGAPFDRAMLFGNGKYYGAELAFEAAQGAGITLGDTVPLGKLAEPDSPLAAWLLTTWQSHPYCESALDAADCWSLIGRNAIVTPGALMASDALMKVHEARPEGEMSGTETPPAE